MESCEHQEAPATAEWPEGTVFVDALFVAEARNEHVRRVGAQNGHRWCHLWSDDVEALHAFAVKIGMRREWFQDRADFPHYDLTPALRAEAVRCGAAQRSLMDYLRCRRAAEAMQGGAVGCNDLP